MGDKSEGGGRCVQDGSGGGLGMRASRGREKRWGFIFSFAGGVVVLCWSLKK